MTHQRPNFEPISRSEGIKCHRRHLPHWEQDLRIYFVTFRLADSIPQKMIRYWEEEKNQALMTTANENEQKMIIKRFQTKFNRYLDRGLGSCVLSEPAISAIVQETFLHFDTIRYVLDVFVIMPNHVHVLVMPLRKEKACSPLTKILHTWKSFSAKRINKMLGKTGEVWKHESFDHMVRSTFHLEKYRKYIEENPKKAGLGGGKYLLGCGVGVQA